MTLGSTAALDLGAARKPAKDILAAVRLGRDPASAKIEARERAGETFGTLLVAYLAHKRASQGAQLQGDRAPSDQVRALAVCPPGGRDRSPPGCRAHGCGHNQERAGRRQLHARKSERIFHLAHPRGTDRAQPMRATSIRRVTNKSRDRVLTDDELRALWAALDDDDYSDIIRLLVYTAARTNEIGGLRWSEINFDKAQIEIPAARMKNGKPHVIPLSEPALAILKRRERGDREHVFGRGASGFQGWSWRRKDLDARIAGKRPIGCCTIFAAWPRP